MNYLGYHIQVRGRSWQGNLAAADIAGRDGECISIADTDPVAVESTAREIVHYAALNRTTLSASARRVLY